MVEVEVGLNGWLHIDPPLCERSLLIAAISLLKDHSHL
jgi:hypothetical protein